MRYAPRSRVGAAVTLAVAALIAIATLLAAAPTAQATNPPIAISPDGVTYAASYPGQLFDGVVLVPGASATRSFWVKNTGTSGANLALTLVDVAGVDHDFLTALSVTATAAARSGTATFAGARQCTPLIKGIHLAKNQAVKVDVTLSMANVGGTTAQNAVASFNIGVTMTSDDVKAPNGCQPINPAPPHPTPTPDPTDSGDGDGNGGDSGDGDTVVIPGLPDDTDTSATPTPTPSVSPSATPSPEPTPSPQPETPEGIKGNTDRFYQEWFVALWVVGFVVGGFIAWWLVPRRRSEGTGR